MMDELAGRLKRIGTQNEGTQRERHSNRTQMKKNWFYQLTDLVNWLFLKECSMKVLEAVNR